MKSNLSWRWGWGACGRAHRCLVSLLPYLVLPLSSPFRSSRWLLLLEPNPRHQAPSLEYAAATVAPPPPGPPVMAASSTPPWPSTQHHSIKLVAAAALDCISNHNTRFESDNGLKKRRSNTVEPVNIVKRRTSPLRHLAAGSWSLVADGFHGRGGCI